MNCQHDERYWTDWYTVKSINKKQEWGRRHCTICRATEDTEPVYAIEDSARPNPHPTQQR